MPFQGNWSPKKHQVAGTTHHTSLRPAQSLRGKAANLPPFQAGGDKKSWALSQVRPGLGLPARGIFGKRNAAAQSTEVWAATQINRNQQFPLRGQRSSGCHNFLQSVKRQ
jgi:hypothetical protein